MIPFSTIFPISKEIAEEGDAHFLLCHSSSPIESSLKPLGSSQQATGPLDKHFRIYPCNSSSIEHALQGSISSGGLVFTMPHSATPHEKILLKDRNLELLSPQDAAQKIHALGLRNCVFVLKKAKEEKLEIYLLPKLQGAMDQEPSPSPAQKEELLIQAKKQEIAELEHILNQMGVMDIYQRRQETLDLYLEELRTQIQFLSERRRNKPLLAKKKYIKRKKLSYLQEKNSETPSPRRGKELYVQEESIPKELEEASSSAAMLISSEQDKKVAQEKLPETSQKDPLSPSQAVSKEDKRLFYQQRSSCLRQESTEYPKEAPLGVIKAKLANFLEDPLHVKLEEFKRAVGLLKKISEHLSPEIPWEGFLDAYALFKDLCIEQKTLRDLYLYSQQLTDGFLDSRVLLDEKADKQIEEKFLALYQELRSFLRQEGFLQEQPYLTLSLLITTDPLKQLELLLEGGALALALAEAKQKEEYTSSSRLYEEDYNKPASVKSYEEACAYFAAAYRLSTKCPELSEKSLAVFDSLCMVQGKHLSIHMAQDERLAEDYALGFKVRRSLSALSKLSQSQKQELIKGVENVAEYLQAWGYSQHAYYLYNMLYDQFEKDPEVDAEKYSALATELGSKSSAAKAKARFFEKVQQLGKEIEKIRSDSATLLSSKGISLEEQKKTSARYRALIREFFHTCSLLLDPRGQYSYALIIVGSLARDEMCPFSDFEVALILEKEDDRAHFTKVAELFHLLVISLGETKVEIVGKEETLPQGFSLDKYNNPLRLCHTADKLATRQKKEKEDPVQLNVLRSSSFLIGKEALVNAYHNELNQVLNTSIKENSGETWRKKHAVDAIRKTFSYDKERKVFVYVDPIVLEDGSIDIKEKLLRFCVFAFEALCLYYAIDTNSHTIEKVRALCEKGLFPQELQEPFVEYLCFAFGLRWNSHLQAGEEWDTYTLDPQEKETVSLAFHLLLKPLKSTLEKWVQEQDLQKDPTPVLQDPIFFATAYFEQAQVSLSQGNLKQAHMLAENALFLKEDPSYLKLYIQLSFYLGHFTKAKEGWQKIQQSLQEKLPSFAEKERASFEEYAQEEKLLRDLIPLALEQETIQKTMREAFAELRIKTALPFSQEKTPLEISELKGLLHQNFLQIWEKSLTIWLTALLNGDLTSECLVLLFKKTYTQLSKPYRKKVCELIVTQFSDKLSLLKGFYCEEGYIFSAKAKTHTWLKTLHRSILREKDPHRSGSQVAGLYTPKGFFHKEMEESLFQNGKAFKKTIAWGNHPVTKTQGSFFKKDPESPGDEYAVFLLNHLVTGQGSPPIEILGVTNQESHLLLASQEIEGEPLKTFLANNPKALSKIDKKQFSQMFLMALLIDPEDGKADNYIAQYTKDEQGRITNFQIIGVDNDHVFVKPFVQEGWIFKESKLSIKTILFCFDEMRESFHSEVVQDFLQLDVTAVLETWLEGLEEYNLRVEQLLEENTLNQYLSKNIMVPFFMHPTQVLYLHDKMVRLQQALNSPKKVKSHLDLLMLIHPRLGETYAGIFNKQPSPLGRFKQLTESCYNTVDGYAQTMTVASNLKKCSLKEAGDSSSQGDPQTIQDYKRRGLAPKDPLKVISQLDHKRLQEISAKPLTSFQEDLKKLLTTSLLEELLERQDWSKVPAVDLSGLLKKFEKAPLHRVHLSQCSLLTDKQLIRFIEGCKHPSREEIEIERLYLRSCTGLTNKALEGVKKCPRLKRLYLEGTSFDKIELDTSLSSLALVDLKDCKKLTFLKIEGGLKKLSVQGCSKLQNLVLHCPELNSLLVEGTPSTLKYQASQQTPLSEALFPLLKQAQTEEKFTLDIPVSEATARIFLNAFPANIVLKELFIDLSGKVIPLNSLPLKIDFKHPSNLEKIHLSFSLLQTLSVKETALLRILEIKNSPKLHNTSALIQELTKLTSLRELDLQGCGGLRGEWAADLIEKLPNLEKFTLPSSLLDYQNASGRTLLHLAVLEKNRKLVLHLVSQGMDLEVPDSEGNTPLQIARMQDGEMARQLEKIQEERAYVESITFGRKDWEKYFGDVGVEPPLPVNIYQIFQGPCPIWPGKKIQDTHLLTLIPEKVDGKPLTLNSLQELVKNPKGGGNKTDYRSYWDVIKNEHGSKPSGPSYWVLMTKDVLPSTRNKPYEKQLAELNTLAARAPKTNGLGDYQTPKALEAATSILMEYVRSGIRLYSDPEGSSKQWTYTRCEETVTYNKTQYLVAVGGFAASGLTVNDARWDNERYGLGGVRKCFGSWCFGS